MTPDLEEMLRPDWLKVIKVRMAQQGHNQSSLARKSDFTPAHIGNILNGKGSDEALRIVCSVLELDITSLMKEEYQKYASGTDNTDRVA